MTFEGGKIALLGAAGAIGQSIAAALRGAGRAYRVVGRSREALARQFGHDPLAEIVTWNPDEPESVRAATRGIETIVYLVGVNYWQFELHPQLMAKTLAGAMAEGVERVLLIGTVYPYGRPRTERVREDHPREPHTFKGRMRKAQEDLLLEAAAGRIEGAVLRLPDFYGPGRGQELPPRRLRGGEDGPDGQPDRTARRTARVRLRARRRAGGRSAAGHAGGMGPRLASRRGGRDHPATHGRRDRAPGRAAAEGQGRRQGGCCGALGLFSPLMREMVEMHYLLTNPVIMDDTALQELIGPIAKTHYAEGVRRTLAATRALGAM